MNNENLTYDDVNFYAKKLAKKINKSHAGKDIVTFVKGGVFTTAFVCNYLSYKPFIVCFDPEKPTNIEFDSFIIVDDILDTGKTILKFESMCKIATNMDKYFLIDKIGCENRVHIPLNCYSACIYDSDTWVKFPWEIT